jgi:[ribosomal protein S18]-alanine N-acetyltransferase
VIRAIPQARIEIRPMVEEDLDAVMEIERHSFKAPWSRQVFREELGREWAYLRVAVPNDDLAPAGFVNFWLVRDEIHILNLATHPVWRRKGLAAALLAHTIAFAKEHEVRHVTLEVRHSNHGAIRLYRSFDFRPIGVRPKYYVEDREDAIVMLLTLGADGTPVPG